MPAEIFQTFLLHASEAGEPVTVKMVALTPAPAPDLEGVLTFQTKLQGCTHIFIGKCVSPPSR